MVCPRCGATNEAHANFCRMCASKLRPVCNCWIAKGPYNCGQEKCPGMAEAIGMIKAREKL